VLPNVLLEHLKMNQTTNVPNVMLHAKHAKEVLPTNVLAALLVSYTKEHVLPNVQMENMEKVPPILAKNVTTNVKLVQAETTINV